MDKMSSSTIEGYKPKVILVEMAYICLSTITIKIMVAK